MVKKLNKNLYRYVVYQETSKGDHVAFIKTTSQNLMRASVRRLTDKGISNFWTIELIPKTRK